MLGSGLGSCNYLTRTSLLGQPGARKVHREHELRLGFGLGLGLGLGLGGDDESDQGLTVGPGLRNIMGPGPWNVTGPGLRNIVGPGPWKVMASHGRGGQG